ncbi:hypothetical protein LC1Nh_1053 [Candidatus Nanohalobium constans]|uniref:Uncharacterized protein n=2 Tax=Candidatus Nanohalobium constans TaxID=2565781 RepID=A0A5Q0UIZ5_9ARCH|nr:hypothetical protein LC1Nh_1053 [Candidatus Nanohalobium constans]
MEFLLCSMSEVDVSDGSLDVVRESVSRELDIVERKLERFRERLEDFEDEHDMDSEEFLEEFESGNLGDDQDYFEWKAVYQSVQRLEDRKERLEKAEIK